MTFVVEPSLPINENYRNFGGLVAEVIQYGFGDGPQINKKRIEAWLNEAQFQIARQVEAPEFQALSTIALFKGTYMYPLPVNFTRMESLYLPAMQVRLRPVDQHEFDRNSPLVEGPPMIYALRENYMWLYPTPISNEGEGPEEGLHVRYYRRPEYMTTETAIPTVNPNYWHLLIDYAVARAFKAEDDTEQAQAHMNTYKEGLDHYASDVQRRDVDGPRTIPGTWGSGTFGKSGWY